ncbi:MAG TPA: type VI secretion system protein TssA [Stellaceae bacterium]|nr:type VI secretion system protein TssA [Stellaceae bacterium]
MSLADDARANLGSAPIPGDKPAGINARYEPDFEIAQQEVAKIEESGSAAVSWKEVERRATAVLSGISKDFLAASYLTLALYNQESYAGLAVGLNVIHGIAANFWGDAFPTAQRERGRVAPIEWLSEKVGALVAVARPTEAQYADVKLCAALVDTIIAAFNDKLTTEKLGFVGLLRPLRGYIQEIEFAEDEARKSAEAAAAAPPPAAAAAGMAPLVLAADASPGDIEAALDALRESIAGIARALRAADPADPRSYELLRVGGWAAITRPPPAQGVATMLPPPPDFLLTGSATMIQQGNFRGLVDLVEDAVPSALFWLDAHRLVATALEGLGHTLARQAVIRETLAFVERVSGLVDLAFQDGTPFAGPETRDWLAASRLQAGGAGEGEAKPWADALGKARILVGEGRLSDAFGLIGTGRAAAPDGRAEFRWSLTQARLCVEIGRARAAAPLIEHLGSIAGVHELERWEPSLAAELAELAIRCYGEAQDTVEDAPRRLIEWQARLCRTDMVKAVALVS